MTIQFRDLPNEIIWGIFRFLTPTERNNLAATCKTIYASVYRCEFIKAGALDHQEYVSCFFEQIRGKIHKMASEIDENYRWIRPICPVLSSLLIVPEITGELIESSGKIGAHLIQTAPSDSSKGQIVSLDLRRLSTRVSSTCMKSGINMIGTLYLSWAPILYRALQLITEGVIKLDDRGIPYANYVTGALHDTCYVIHNLISARLWCEVEHTIPVELSARMLSLISKPSFSDDQIKEMIVRKIMMLTPTNKALFLLKPRPDAKKQLIVQDDTGQSWMVFYNLLSTGIKPIFLKTCNFSPIRTTTQRTVVIKERHLLVQIKAQLSKLG